MRLADFLTALYAATQSVADGDVDEAEVTFDQARGEWVNTLTVRLSRYQQVEEDAEVAE